MIGVLIFIFLLLSLVIATKQKKAMKIILWDMEGFYFVFNSTKDKLTAEFSLSSHSFSV